MFVLIILLCLCVGFIILQLKSRRPKNFPPGPPALPVLNNKFEGKSVSPGILFYNMASNIICQVLFGKRFEYDDKFIKVIVQCFRENAKITNGPWAMGMLVIPNLGSALTEEGQWKFPDEFNPENFLNDQGEFFKPEAFLPFSAGPRMCLGEALARMELFLILVTLLRKFKFVWPQDAGEPDLTPVYGSTLSPKPYCMNVQLRATQ